MDSAGYKQQLSLAGRTDRVQQLAHVSLVDGADNTLLGLEAGARVAGRNNTFVGSRVARVSAATSNTNVVVGAQAAEFLGAASSQNVVVGALAGQRLRHSSQNVVLGAEAGRYMHQAVQCTVVGFRAGGELAAGARNTFVGAQAGYYAYNTQDNVFVGDRCGMNNRVGARNTFVGAGAGINATRGNDSVLIGYYAAANGAGIDGSVVIGGDVAPGANVVVDSVVLGAGAAAGAANVTESVVVGHGAGAGAADVDSGVFLGTSAGAGATGAYNTFVGREAGELAAGNLNAALGYAAAFDMRGNGSVALGAQAGQRFSGDGSLVAGAPGTGVDSRGDRSTLINGPQFFGGNDSTAIGGGYLARADNLVAIGGDVAAWVGTGRSCDGGVLIGYRCAFLEDNVVGNVANAGGVDAVVVGARAAQNWRGNAVVLVGAGAGLGVVGDDAVAIGRDAGADLSGVTCTVVGARAGQSLVGGQAVAVGAYAGQNLVGEQCSLVGFNAGSGLRGDGAVVVGHTAAASLSGNGGVVVGYSAGSALRGDYCTVAGFAAADAMVGDDAVVLGRYAGSGLRGNGCVIAGLDAGRALVGDDGVAIGRSAGRLLVGDDAVLVGTRAGNVVTGDHNVLVGADCGSLVQGSRNTAVGDSSLRDHAGNSCTVAGADAGTRVRADQLTVVGAGAGADVVGDRGTLLGTASGRDVVGDDLTAAGFGAAANVVGSFNTLIGADCGYLLRGNNITAVGYSAAGNISGDNLVVFGTSTASVLYDSADSVFVGSGLFADDPLGVVASNVFALGAQVSRAATQAGRLGVSNLVYLGTGLDVSDSDSESFLVALNSSSRTLRAVQFRGAAYSWPATGAAAYVLHSLPFSNIAITSSSTVVAAGTYKLRFAGTALGSAAVETSMLATWSGQTYDLRLPAYAAGATVTALANVALSHAGGEFGTVVLTRQGLSANPASLDLVRSTQSGREFSVGAVVGNTLALDDAMLSVFDDAGGGGVRLAARGPLVVQSGYYDATANTDVVFAGGTSEAPRVQIAPDVARVHTPLSVLGDASFSANATALGVCELGPGLGAGVRGPVLVQSSGWRQGEWASPFQEKQVELMTSTKNSAGLLLVQVTNRLDKSGALLVSLNHAADGGDRVQLVTLAAHTSGLSKCYAYALKSNVVYANVDTDAYATATFIGARPPEAGWTFAAPGENPAEDQEEV